MTLSVIIPTYNEEEFIAETIETVRSRAAESNYEILVVDGGSTDQTIEQVEEAGADVFRSPKQGRAAQMNYGARQASGELLYFLHADSHPPNEFDEQIQKAVDQGYESGCFRLAFDDDHPLLTLYAWFTRFDVDAFRFGDQSLFVRRNVFQEIEGFREDHIVMEDNEIVRRIKNEYSFTILDDAVTTSARMYREVGVVKLQLLFILIFTLYFLGVDQETLADIKHNI